MSFTATLVSAGPWGTQVTGGGHVTGAPALPSPVATVTVTAPAVEQTVVEPQPVVEHAGNGGLPVVVLVVVAIGCVTIGLLVGRLIRSLRRSTEAPAATPTLRATSGFDPVAARWNRGAPLTDPATPDHEPKITRPACEEHQPAMDTLALACLQLADAVTSPALRGDIERALRAVGYEFLDPIGQPFDPRLHDAVERRATPDARAHNVVAATYRPGCAGRGSLLRTPEVAVYRFEVAR